MRGKQAASTPPEPARPVRNRIALALLVVITAASIFALFSLIARQSDQSDTGAVVTVAGTPVCLPHKPEGPFTAECALGLRGDDGRYYALDNIAANLAEEDFGKRVRVKGKLYAPHADTMYDIAGRISVDSATRQ